MMIRFVHIVLHHGCARTVFNSQLWCESQARSLVRVGMAVSVGGIAYVIVLFLFSLVGTIVCLAPALPLLFAAPVLYAKWCNLIEYLYFTFCACMIRLLLGTRMEVHGDASAIHHDLVNSLVISNHRYARMWVASATCWNRCNRGCKLV